MPATIFVPDDHVTIAFDTPITIYSTDPNWDQVVEFLHDKDFESIRALVSRTSDIILSYNSGRISIDGGIVFVDDNPVEGALVDRLIDMLQKAIDVKPIAQFIANVHDNPKYNVSDDAYGFVEEEDLPITSDGCLLAYQRVRWNWTDIDTTTLDLSIGSVAENVELSFCGLDRLACFFSGWDGSYRTIVIKINPRDIITVPTAFVQGVCSKYEVVGELEEEGWKVDGAYSDDFDEKDPEDMDDDELTVTANLEALDNDEVFDFGSDFFAGYKEFSTRQEAMDYVKDNPGYNVRDRGPDREDRWYVSPPDGLAEL